MLRFDPLINYYLPIPTAVERAMMEMLGEMQLQIQHLTAAVQNLQNSTSRGRSLPDLTSEEDIQLPLRSMDDRLEGKLKDKETKNKLVIKTTAAYLSDG